MESCDDGVQLIDGTQLGSRVTEQQLWKDNHVVFCTRDVSNKILILFVVTVKESELLLSVSRIIHRVNGERDGGGRRSEGIDKLFNAPVLHHQQVCCRDRILQP